MDTTNLKKYAPKARRKFLRAVTDRAMKFGITRDKIEPITEQGDVVVIGDIPYPKSVGGMRKKLIGRIESSNFEKVMEEAAYTWFNRLIAIRYMEVHGYLDHGYRVLSHPEGRELPEIIDYAECVYLPGLDSDTVVELKLDGTKEAGLYRMLLVAQCNALHRYMPFMFDYIEGDIELLLPDNLLHSDSLVRQLIKEVPEGDFREIESIGWLYQFYISEKKDDVFAALKKGNKIAPENIPAATQLFTPHWIVRYLVENSLGRLWMLNHPDSRLIEQMDYYIKPEEPETDFLRIESPEEIKICDPACGSGHMLTYAFDLLYAIYEEQGYQATDIPSLILNHNLYGIEIDRRSGALAAFALAMKVREKHRRALTSIKAVQPNICVLESIQIETEDISAYQQQVGCDLLSNDLIEVVNQWREADNFGSLIRPLVTDVSEVLESLRKCQMGEDLFLAGVHQKVIKALRQADYLSPKYHVVVANPPYMGSRGMNGSLFELARASFTNSKADLFAMFVERFHELCIEVGNCAAITMHSWMFIASFEKFRHQLLQENCIKTMAHIGARGFDSIGGEVVSTTAFITTKLGQASGVGVYVRLVDGKSEAEKQLALRASIQEGSNQFRANSFDFLRLPSAPIAYWLSEPTRNTFSTYSSFGHVAEARKGLVTLADHRFIRYWFEVSRLSIYRGAANAEEAQSSSSKWFPVVKAGKYRKWFGLNENVINWEDNGRELKDYIVEKYSGGSYTKEIRSEEFYFRDNITWGDVTTNKLSFRATPTGYLFSSVGPSAFFKNERDKLVVMAIANGPYLDVISKALNPTLHFTTTDFSNVPLAIPKDFVEDEVEECVKRARQDWDQQELSWDFMRHPLLEREDLASLKDAAKRFYDSGNEATQKMQLLEQRINARIIEAYGLSDEMSANVDICDVTLFCNPTYRYGSDKNGPELEALLLADTMREFISYAVGCMLGRYSLEKPGLILANQAETAEDHKQQVPESTFAPDEGNVIPILDSGWFNDDITNRFNEFLQLTFGKENFTENLAFLESTISKNIRKYFLTEFYKHHIKLYKKRPIYWLFSSGKLKAFQALIYMHRYNPGSLSRMRTSYVVPLQGKFSGRLEQLDAEIDYATSSRRRGPLERERAKLIRQRAELIAFDEKLHRYADQKIEIDLDDGVKVNYGKFGDLLAEAKTVVGKKAK